MTEPFRFGHIEIRPAERLLMVGGERAKLGGRAFDVLLALVERRDRIVGKNEILDTVWPGLVVEENNLQVHISTLRKALGAQVIATIPGRGYRFTAAPDRGGDSEPGASPHPTGAALKSPEHALPALLGRESDLDTLRKLVLAHRVVTVVGAGGIGKTTLVRTFAHQMRGGYDDGACLIELAPVSDPSLVATTVATALQVTLGNKSPVDAISQALAARRMLVVLDNCEHLLQSVAELVTALRPIAPGVHWLATSQEPLKLGDEQVFRLGALALPVADTLEAARRAGAVALFEARARAADPRFALTEGNVATAIEICRHLDGIALAIELAAARVTLLGLEGLRNRLGERLRILTSGARVALPRHRTLLAALEWSYGLLTPAQQSVYRRLGTFSGGFTLDAAQRVAADGTIDEWAVLDDLGALVDKSLVVAEPDSLDEPRYRLLETMRQHALDRLEAAGDGATTRTRHLDVFVALAERAKDELFSRQQGAWMKRLDADHENLLAAHAWCGHLADGGERDLRLVTGLGRYWLNRALLSLGYRVTSEALDRPDAQSRNPLRCQALTQAGRLGARIGQYAQALQLHREAIAIGRELGAVDILADALTNLGMACLEQGDLTGARAPMEEALALALEGGGDSDVFGGAATSLGELERLEGRWAAARSLYEASLAQARRHGEHRGIVSNLNNLTMTAISLGNVADARAFLIESIERQDERVTRYGQMFGPLLCAGLAALLGDWRASARFEGAAVPQFEQLGWPLDPADKAYLDSFTCRTRDALGHIAYAEERATGSKLTFEDVLVEMRQWLRDLP